MATALTVRLRRRSSLIGSVYLHLSVRRSVVCQRSSYSAYQKARNRSNDPSTPTVTNDVLYRRQPANVAIGRAVVSDQIPRSLPRALRTALLGVSEALLSALEVCPPRADSRH